MSFPRTLRLGLKNIWLHGLRSLLTVLGIICGVGSVIAMLSIGEGLGRETEEAIRALGSRNLVLRSARPPERAGPDTNRPWTISYGLTYEDLRAIEATIPGLAGVAPSREIRKDVHAADRRLAALVVGTAPAFARLLGLETAIGRFLAAEDVEGTANVCVLGAAAARALFPAESPIGRTVRIGADAYAVVGVLRARDRYEGRSAAAAASLDLDAAVFIPLTTVRAWFGPVVTDRRAGSMTSENVALHQVVIGLSSDRDVLPAARAVAALLERRRPRRDYEVIVPLELLREAQRTARLFTFTLGAIAAISLLVGGIGIMNIMLATVTERTREIGIRRALGARRRDIVIEFLVETGILSAGGGAIGVAIGLLLPPLLGSLAQMRTVTTVPSVVLAFGLSVATGLSFGVYPARRAARLSPIEALRHE